MILVTGFTGNTGSHVAAGLARAGVPFKVLARSDASKSQARKLGYEPVSGDFDRPETLTAALREGFERAYLVCTPDEQMVRRERSFIDAAREAGVKHIVKLSALHAAADSPSPNLRAHADVERRLASSGMNHTVVRPHGFMQTFVVFSMDLIRAAGAYVHAAGDGRMPLVDVRDVATVAIKALTEEGHAGKAYDVTGPESLSFAEQAQALSRALGRPVTYVPGSSRAQLFAAKLMGVAPQSIEHVRVIMDWCREGKLAATTDTLVQLGVTPTSFANFADDLAHGRTGGGSSFQPPGGIAFDLVKTVAVWSLRAQLAIARRKRVS